MVAFDLEEVIEEEKLIDDQIKEHTEMLITVEAEIEQVKYFYFRDYTTSILNSDPGKAYGT